MAKKETLTRSSMMECKACRCPVGEAVRKGEPPVLPFRIDGGNNDWETFCPQCAVYVRMPKEPARFVGFYFPVACLVCRTISVAVGAHVCSACRSRHIIYLPPKIAA